MSDRKTTPKAGITLLSREDDKLKFFHSPSGAADFALKHKLNKQLSLGLGFTVRSVACRWCCWGVTIAAPIERDEGGGGQTTNCLIVPLSLSARPPLHALGQRTAASTLAIGASWMPPNWAGIASLARRAATP